MHLKRELTIVRLRLRRELIIVHTHNVLCKIVFFQQAIYEAMQPSIKWRPADPKNRTGKYDTTSARQNHNGITPAQKVYTLSTHNGGTQDANHRSNKDPQTEGEYEKGLGCYNEACDAVQMETIIDDYRITNKSILTEHL